MKPAFRTVTYSVYIDTISIGIGIPIKAKNLVQAKKVAIKFGIGSAIYRNIEIGKGNKWSYIGDRNPIIYEGKRKKRWKENNCVNLFAKKRKKCLRVSSRDSGSGS